jgi:actin related protein 2/3 complex subunit 1A/1B
MKLPTLPLISLLFLNEQQIVAAGYDSVPYLFEQRPEGWKFVRKLDEGTKKSGNVDSAMNKFRQMDSKGQTTSDSALDSVHQNTITSIVPFEVVNGSVTKFTTSGQDGMLVVWDVLSLGVKQLSIR